MAADPALAASLGCPVLLAMRAAVCSLARAARAGAPAARAAWGSLGSAGAAGLGARRAAASRPRDGWGVPVKGSGALRVSLSLALAVLPVFHASRALLDRARVRVVCGL